MKRRKFIPLASSMIATHAFGFVTSPASLALNSDGWLESAKPRAISGGFKMARVRFLVIHFTEGHSAESSIQWWKDPKAQGACAHFVIDRDGSLYQCRSCFLSGAHAGISQWKGTHGLNQCSIGIELANGGSNAKVFNSHKESGLIHASHKNGGEKCNWEAYSHAQLNTCTKLSEALNRKFRFEDIIGHDDISPGRKNDPGPAFPMETFRKNLGF